MLRSISLLLLSAMLFVQSAAPAHGGWRPAWDRPGWRQRIRDEIAGTYVNQSNGRQCYVNRQGRGYEFVNENGTPAQFVFTGPGRLQMVSGDWDPDIVVSVSRDRVGRTVLRFDSPNAAPGVWVSVGY
jgi:hypothetical protein